MMKHACMRTLKVNLSWALTCNHHNGNGNIIRANQNCLLFNYTTHACPFVRPHYCIPECGVQPKCTSVSESDDVVSNTVEPETSALMGWIRNNPFVLTVSLQGGSQVAVYPSLGNVNNSFF